MKLKSLCPVPCRGLLCVSSFRLGPRFQMDAYLAGCLGLCQPNGAVDVGHGVGNASAKRKEEA